MAEDFLLETKALKFPWRRRNLLWAPVFVKIINDRLHYISQSMYNLIYIQAASKV